MKNPIFKNIIEQLKNNWCCVLLPIIFISFLLINLNVVYFGDDFYYLTYTNLELTDYFTKLGEHYQQSNGRFIVHLLATIFLNLPMPIWQILNSAMLTGICYFASKLITQNKKEKQPLILSIFFFLIAALNISITRQSVYWLTGSFNYVYPLFLFFAYWCCLLKIDSKKHFILAILLGFLSASSVEQCGMMTLGLTILTYLKDFNGLKNLKAFFKSHLKQFILILITLIGVATVILAPSQFTRLEEETEKQASQNLIVNNVKYLLFSFSSEPNAFPFIILLDLSLVLYGIQKLKKYSKTMFITSTFFNFIFAVINIWIIDASFYFTPIRILLIFGILITYGIAFIILSKELSFKIISPLTIPIILMIGSQFMMIISPVLGPRNLIFGLILFAYIIAFVVNLLEPKHSRIPICTLIILALILNLKTALGYVETRKTDEKNIQILEENKETLKDNSKVITLYKFKNDNYGWSMPYVSNYHEFYFKHFYEINCKINWE